MKLFKLLFKKIYFLYSDSIKRIHLGIFFITVGLYLTLNYFDFNNLSESYIDILNGMGILTSFFILVIDKIDIKSINKKFQNERPIANGKRHIKTGYWISNTLFSLTITMFVLLGLLYILLFFNTESIFLLIWLIVNIFISFLFALMTWSFLEQN